MATLTLTAALETVEGGLIQARLVELPGVITVAATPDEAIDALVDALHEYLLAEAPAPTSRGERIPLCFTLA
jgi:predicted RNase H-like HicB family nuclease